MKRGFFYTILLIPFLSGCVSQEKAAPVIQLKGAQSIPKSGFHVVSRGETLYQISWGYGKDYRELAEINHIYPPYVIYPGQKLKINGSGIIKSPPKLSKPEVSHAVHEKWDWPVKGKVIKSFGLKGTSPSKGIDIAGKLGTPIRAALSGKVVYSGMGLRGYGQLIIVKHNDTYLSAYAHNSSLLVKEGDVVKKGQIISKMGQTDSDSVKLHFEIRKNGQPVDPLPILPS